MEDSAVNSSGFHSANDGVPMCHWEYDEDFTINEMLEWQRKLQDEYKEWWQPICPESGKDKLLWMIGEIGEVIDAVKKNGNQKIAADPHARAHFVEEMADVLMFYGDVLLCYGITAGELKRAYIEKAKSNMTRWK